MSSSTLIQSFKAAGITLWCEGDTLRYRAPSGAMTPQRIAQLKRHKAELLSALAIPEWIDDHENRDKPYPLTGLQSAYLMGRSEAFALGGVDCHGYLEFRFAELDVVRLQNAWQLLVMHHEMLRTQVFENGTQQTLSEIPTVTLHALNLSDLPVAEQQQRLHARRESLSHYQGQPDCWPLIRLEVTQLSEAAILHISFNLLVCDFYSARQLLAQLSEIYQGGSITPPPVSFRDYVINSQRQQKTLRYQQAHEYWMSRIASLPAAPVLPACALPLTSRFYRESFVLPPEQFARLSQQAAAQGVGLSALFVTLYAATLQRWGAGNHFGLSLTMMQRQPLHPAIDQVIGDFSAVELLEVNLNRQHSLIDQASQLQEQLWRDLDHSAFTGIDVLRELARQRGREAALYPVAFTSAISSGTDCCTQLLQGAQQTYSITQTPQVALDCQISPGETGLHINWDIREGTLDPDTAADMFNAFRGAILSLCDHPQAWKQPIVIPLPAAQIQRHAAMNDTERMLPQGLMHTPVWQQARQSPTALAVMDASEQLSYQQLVEEADALASHLLAQGMKPGSRVVIALEKSVRQIVAVLAAMRAGAAWIPLDITLPAKRQQWLLNLAKPDAILVHSRQPLTEVASAALPTPFCIDQLTPLTVPTQWPVVSPDALAYVIYTSGSTGEPKGVMISHKAARNTLEAINQRLQPAEGDRLLGLANLSFDLAVYDIFGILATGAALILPESRHRSDPWKLAQLIAEHQITLWNSVPAQLAMLVDYLHSEAGSQCSTLRAALLSGDWIPVDLPARAHQVLTQATLFSLGGATEAAIWSVLYPITTCQPEWVSIPYGRPLPNQRMYVLDAEMAECPDGIAGELYIGGAGLALGYDGDPEKTAQRFITHPHNGERLYRTGDLAAYQADGNLQFLGREDDQLKVRGHRIELAEIETTLIQHPDIASANVLVMDRGASTQRLLAFITAASRSLPLPDSLVGKIMPEHAQQLAEAMNRKDVLQLAKGIEEVSLLAMAQALLSLPQFASNSVPVALADLVNSGAVAPRHQRLIGRWLRALTEQGFLRQTDASHYVALKFVTPLAVEQCWHDLHQLGEQVNWGTAILRYMHDSHLALPALMRNEVDPLDLLFPEGQTHVAEAAYRDNLVSRTVNSLVCATIRQIAREKEGQTLRLLEVGAGVGGTSLDLIPALAEFSVDYLFSDLSHYFLNEAEKRFSQWPWVRYGLYDINQSALPQGIEPASRDVILCANVLHNSRHAADVIARLKEILVPGGWIVFIEATSNSYQIMSSMEFKEGLTGFEDRRQEQGTTFMSVEDWQHYLQQAGATDIVIAPQESLALQDLGQHVFAARFKTHLADVDQQALQTHLQQWLPGWMLPDTIHALDQLPLTSNGKIDRRALAALVPEKRVEASRSTEAPSTALEKDIAKIWQSVLKVDSVGRHDNFFTLGGDSLLVAQVVSRLRASLPQASGWGWDTLLRAMMNEQDLAALAQRFSQQSISSYSLQVLQSGEQSETTLLLVHDGSGTLTPYRALLNNMDKRQRVIGLALNTPEQFLAHPAESGIALLAQQAVEVLTQQNETSPLHIVGYCLGGMLAQEIASQLTGAGREIKQLSIISSYPVPFRIEDDLLAEYIFARVVRTDPQRLGYPQDENAFQRLINAILNETPGVIPQGSLARFSIGKTDAASHAITSLASRSADERLDAIHRHSVFANSEANTPARVHAQYKLIRHSLLAVNGHRLQDYTQPVTFLRQQGEMQVLPAMNSEMTLFWQRHSGQPLLIHDIPGDHFSCLNGDNCTAILRALGLSEEAKHE
ncbi:hypothetical protein QU24_20325 [Pantoea rodasii]|uniref:L-cysteine--[L-cysteinyl-carrier protein] ligase n=1 Tax=Pantoea rodasii TaxID=1076549 RepID=A0A0B1R3I7_9GAMM|nr:non-ribosomal peptide synthetase [Pantoea rodasii]KHJ66236.1 hypothetical protein QU24_20325 [Pantoea rodasii]